MNMDTRKKQLFWRGDMKLIALLILFFVCGFPFTLGMSFPRQIVIPKGLTLGGRTIQTPTPSPFVGVAGTSTLTRTLQPTSVEEEDLTRPVVSSTKTVTQGALSLIGEELNDDAPSINAGNIAGLAQVALWGKGGISAAIFHPDGRSFIVGSSYGVAVYRLDDLKSPPLWLPFNPPFSYSRMYIDQKGKYLRLHNQYVETDGDRYYDLANGTIYEKSPGAVWIIPEGQQTTDAVYEARAISPDGAQAFKGELYYPSEDNPQTLREQGILSIEGSEEGTRREIYDPTTGKTRYFMMDELPYVEISDRSSPEGCYILYFSPCGNAVQPIAMAPNRAAYSPTGDQLAVRYRPVYLGGPVRFSILKIYRASDSSYIGEIGSFDHPVDDFAYSPDGRTLLVTFFDGTIQLWDSARMKPTFTSWHFNAQIEWLKYSVDSQFLLVKRREFFEIRLARNGNLVSRHSGNAAAISPVDNLFAIADPDGVIYIKRMDGQTVQRLEGHEKEIYSLEFSPDGKYLVSSSRDCTIRHWEVNSGKFLHFYEAFTAYPYESDWGSRIFIYQTAFIPNSNMLIGFGSWSTAVVWDIHSGVIRIAVEPEPLEYYSGMMTLNPHFPEYMILDEENGQFFIGETGYDLRTGAPTGKTFEPRILPPEGCSISEDASPDGNIQFSMGYDQRKNQICILDKASGKLLREIEIFLPNKVIYDTAWWFDLSPNGKHLAVYTAQGMIYIYQVIP